MMQLYDSQASPFCRKVQVVLRETGQLDDVTAIPAFGHPVDPNTMPLAQNPLGKIPCLVPENGHPIYDSRVICRYFDSRGNGGLYPSDDPWDVLTMEATADGMMDAAILMVYESRTRPEEIRFAPWVEGQWAKIARALDAVQERWMEQLSGPLHIGQIGIACALGYIDFRHPDRDWRTGRDALADWYEAFIQRDSMAATAPRG